jgi:hypothetical protein
MPVPMGSYIAGNGLITSCRKENNDFGLIEPHWLTEIGCDLGEAYHSRAGAHPARAGLCLPLLTMSQSR